MLFPFFSPLVVAVALVSATPFYAGAESTSERPLSPERLVSYVTVTEDQTLIDLAVSERVGFLELLAANPGVDPWIPQVGSQVIVPATHLVPERMEKGILINLSQMRLFWFPGDGSVQSFAIGIGADGLETPHGTTTIARKMVNPSWHPPAAMRKRRPELPASVPAGPDNPLGTRALYLGWPLYLIHGTNQEYGIGRRASSGCIRMYNAEVQYLYDQVGPGTPVKVIEKRLVAEMVEGRLYLEAHPTGKGWDMLEAGEALPNDIPADAVLTVVQAVPEMADIEIDWDVVDRVIKEQKGYPVAVSR